MIEHLLFDLDNTLYPASAPINKGIASRMSCFVTDFLHVPAEEAAEMRRSGLTRFGTTLEWLRTEHSLDKAGIEAFFAAVHPASEADEVPFDPQLRNLLLHIPLPKSILTNAPIEHAERILRMLSIEDLFVSVCDLRANNLYGKPYPDSYANAAALSGFTIAQTLFIDDHLKYTTGYAKIGGKAVLIDFYNEHEECGFDRLRSVYQLPDYLQKLNNCT